MEDTFIVDLFLSRNEEAIRLVSDKYGKNLRNTAYRITGDSRTAEECENDTYWEAWRRIPPHEPRNYLFSFLLRIVRSISLNRCIRDNRLKRKGYITELTSEMEQCLSNSTSAEDELETKLFSEAVSNFLRLQSTEKRSIFVLRYFYGEKYTVIAKRYRYKESSVRVILFQMRKQLREYLIKEKIV